MLNPGVPTHYWDIRSPGRLALVDGEHPSLPDHDVPTGLRMVRALDRAVLEVARELGLRPMELYALLLLSAGGRLPTSALADRLAASTSQAKQLALRLCGHGMASRGGKAGYTELTAYGRAVAESAEIQLGQAISARMRAIDQDTRVAGIATLADLTLRTA